MEREMYESCVDPALTVLEQFLDDFPTYHKLRWPILTTILDLRFYKMFFWGLAYQQQCSEDDWRLCYSWSNMMRKFTKITEVFRVEFKRATTAERLAGWEAISFRLKMVIEQYKPAVREICILVLGGALIKCCHFEELFNDYGENSVSLVHLILANLRDLDWNFDLSVPILLSLGLIDDKYKILGKFANHVSCLVCLYWIDDMDDGLIADMESMLSDLVLKYMPYAPGIVELYLDVLKGTRHRRCVATHQLIVSYVDFFIEHLIIPLKDDIEILHEGLVFLLSFAMDSPNKDSDGKKSLVADIIGIINEVPSMFCNLETNLSSFLHKINRVKVQIGKLYVVRPELHSPKTDVVGFLNSHLANFKKMLKSKVDFAPTLRDDIKIIHEELVSVCLFLQVKLEPGNEHEELKDVLNQLGNVVYFAAYVTNLCSGTSFVWYGMLCLPNIMEDIKLVKFKVIKKFGNDQIYNHERLTVEIDKSSIASPVQATTSKNEETFIGFKDDVREIQDNLVRGPKNLTIVSVSGMPGQGKTTLAKVIFHDPPVHYHFHQKAWCYVSKECKPKTVLVNIAADVGCNINVNLEIQDIIERLWRSLKGKRYLIVLDDVWDVEVWRQVSASFPNDQNGSRILLTSRNHDLASQAEPNSISYHLRSFTNDESWELMKAKLSDCECLPKAFLEIGERIAVYCKGLPLAVSLVACHLNTVAQVVDVWEEVAGNLKSYLASEGCMHIIELSYKYLQEHLKPCFLYFGAFPRGKGIYAKKLKLLWIAERFVKDNEMQLADEYLDSLVSLNLVVVTKRSSRGGIKECRVRHDLLYDMCLEKGVQDNFLHFADQSIASGSQWYDFYHRLCINMNGLVTLPKSTNTRKELPASQVHTLLVKCYGSLDENYLPCFLRNFRVLTVLNWEELTLPTYRDVLSNNIHLRYLALPSSIEAIPTSIVDLWYLETLIVADGRVVQIPDMLWGMENLKHVHIGKFSVNFNGLQTNRSSISLAATSNIEVLKAIILKYDLEEKEFLERFVRLRKLKCYCDNKEVIPAIWFSMFGSLKKLESIDLRYPFGAHVSQQLPAVNFPKSLRKLSLKGFRLPWSSLSAVGKLSNLEVLKLRNNACFGTAWYLGDGEFLKLKYLKLYGGKELERIDDSGCDYPFPCLEKLLLPYCKRLEEIPASFGEICTLDTIDVTGSDKVLDSVRRVVEQQHDMGNDSLQVFGLK